MFYLKLDNFTPSTPYDTEVDYNFLKSNVQRTDKWVESNVVFLCYVRFSNDNKVVSQNRTFVFPVKSFEDKHNAGDLNLDTLFIVSLKDTLDRLFNVRGYENEVIPHTDIVLSGAYYQRETVYIVGYIVLDSSFDFCKFMKYDTMIAHIWFFSYRRSLAEQLVIKTFKIVEDRKRGNELCPEE